MYKLYNTQKDISRGLCDFIANNVNNIRKTQLNILTSIIFGMIKSESCVTTDIAKNLKDEFSNVFLPSTQRRIRRFFNNKLFNGHDFYSQVISFVIKSYTCKHFDNRIHIAMNHMFIRDRFTVFMLSLRIGKQSIPLWFECFKGKNDPEAYKSDTLIKGIKDEISPWILITNGNPKFAIKDYGYRFGAIEFLFKSQKSNGFFLKKPLFLIYML